MHVAIAGPILTAPLVDHLDTSGVRVEALPDGLGATSVTQLVLGLLERGHDVTVATCARSVPSADDEWRLTGDRLVLRIGPYRGAGRGRDAFMRERRYLRRVLREEPADLLHAHWSYEFALAALRADGRPVLQTVRDWGPTILGYHRDPYRAVRLGMQLISLLRGRHFTAVSPYLRRRVERWVPDCAVVPNGLREELFHESPRAAPDPRPPVLVSVNNGFGRRKNVSTLLRAFSLVRRRHPDSTLRLLGDGYGSGGQAHRWAGEHGLAGGVEFVGSVTHREVVEQLRSASALVHPSREESFGMTLIEAMAQGLPVVGGRDSGAVPWVLDGGDAGVLTDVGSARPLATAIIELLGDGGRRRRLSRSGYERAWSTFRMPVVVDGYIREYARTLAAGAR